MKTITTTDQELTAQAWGHLAQIRRPADPMQDLGAKNPEFHVDQEINLQFQRKEKTVLLPHRIKRIWLQELGDVTVEDCMAEGFRTSLREHDAVVDLMQQHRANWSKEHGPWDPATLTLVFEIERIKRTDARPILFMHPDTPDKKKAHEEAMASGRYKDAVPLRRLPAPDPKPY